MMLADGAYRKDAGLLQTKKTGGTKRAAGRFTVRDWFRRCRPWLRAEALTAACVAASSGSETRPYGSKRAVRASHFVRNEEL